MSTAGLPTLGDRLFFGPFELRPGERLLLCQEAPVALGSRAMDVLLCLLERPGELVSPDELLARAWRGINVNPAALRVQIAALRKAFIAGDPHAHYVSNVAGHGYCFVARMLRETNGAAVAATSITRDRPLIPPAHRRMIGRDAVVDDLAQMIATERFVTLVGPGGIGKTTVALALAHRLSRAFDGEVAFVDMAILKGDESIAPAVATVLGLGHLEGDPIVEVASQLRPRRMLLFLDSCEHVIAAAAALAEAIYQAAPRCHIVATSRERLNVLGERVRRVGALETPPSDAMSFEAVRRYPAAQLFIERVAAGGALIEPHASEAALIADICRKLDGVPLAIELAAGRVDAFGLATTLALLESELRLSWPGRRTAPPRHHTLSATLNWSHELLGPVERIVFRRLSVLVGAFPLGAAMAICGDDSGLSATDVVNALSSLVSKSLVTSLNEGQARFRMLDTTRTYALAQLAESGEERPTRRRQYEHYLARFAAPHAEQDEPAAVAEQTANVGAVLNWAFGEQGDPSIGVRLTGAAAGFWVRHGLLAECRRWANVVQARPEGATPSDLPTRVILANALMVSDGIGGERRREMQAAYANALKHGSLDEKMSALWVLVADEHRRCRYAAAQRLIDEADFLESPDATHADRLAALWQKGMTDHCAGRQAQACERLGQLLREYTEDCGRQFLHQQGYDLETAAETILGMSEFLRGNLEEAFAASDRAIAKGSTLNSTFSLRAALRWRGTMMYLFDEDGLELDRFKREIIPTEAFRDAELPEGTSLAIHGLWLARDGDCVRGAELVRQGLRACIETDYLTIQSFVRAEIALQLLRHGAADRVDEFLSPLENADEEEDWATPEVLRIRGEIAERRGDFALAETRYHEALASAEHQGALTWRLRAAISLADLWLAQGRGEDAVFLLSAIRGKFHSNADCPLLRRATERLSSCRAAGRLDRT